MTHPLLERLRSEDPAVRRAACTEIVDDPSAVLLVDSLSEALGDPELGVARAASNALAQLSNRVDGVTASLNRALRSDDSLRRIGAALTWARVEPPPIKLLPALVEALGMKDGEMRWLASRLIVETGRLHAEVLPLLLQIVQTDPRPLARRMAAHSLRALAPDEPETARALVAATNDSDLRVRRAGFAALAALQFAPAEVLDRLTEALMRDPDGSTRRIAAVALGELGSRCGPLPSPALGALRHAAENPEDGDLRRGARRSLARLEEPLARRGAGE